MKFFKLNKLYPLLILILMSVQFYYGESILPLETTQYDLSFKDVPESFDGFTIVCLSDFHGKKFGSNEEELISQIKAAKPDAIVFNGDMMDASHSLDSLEELIIGIKDLAPIVACPGNHEYDADYSKLLELLDLYDSYGITMLNNSDITFTRGDDAIHIYGTALYISEDTSKRYVLNYVDVHEPEDFNICLYHYANLFDELNLHDNIELVLSGHVHGGIVRLPFLGGLLNNDGTLFPKYDNGVYTNDKGMSLVSNRGLGDAFIPRFNNPPEIVKVVIHPEE